MSSYADEGTIAHALAARCLEDGLDAQSFVGEIFEEEDRPHSDWSPSGAPRYTRCIGSVALSGDADFAPRKFSLEVSQEMAGFVQIYIDNIRQYIGEELDGSPCPFWVEAYGDLSDLLGAEQGGTSDCVIVTSPQSDVEITDEGAAEFTTYELQVHDLKFGRGVQVYAEDNEQLLLYAWSQYRLLKEAGYRFRSVRCVIHQPRIDARPDEWLVTVEALETFAIDIKSKREIGAMALQQLVEDQMSITEWSETYLNPGEKQCMWCRAKTRCPAIKDMVSSTVWATAGPDNFPMLDTEPEKLDGTPIYQMPVAPVDDIVKLDLYMQRVGLIEEWCRDIRAALEKKMLAGEEAPNFKLVRGKRGNREWIDAAAAEATLKQMRYKADQIYTRKVISPTVAEKLLKKNPKRWAQMKDHITQAEGSISVAPITDPREAVKLASEATDFPDETSSELIA